MVSEPDLKSLYEGLAPDDQEMARYRQALQPKLQPRQRLPLWRSWTWALAGAAALIWLAVFLAQKPATFQQESMADLSAMVTATDAQVLTAKAKHALTKADDLQRFNAMAVLCMVLPVNEAITIAGQALQEDPRTEFRVFYLEYLLEEADENLINAHKVEELMDREDDALCLRLLRDLLAIS